MVTTIFDKGIGKLVNVTNAIGGVFLVLMMLFTAADVFLRYVLNMPVAGSIEIVELMMACTVSLALAYTAFRHGHISVDLLVMKVSEDKRLVMDCITTGLGLGIFILITIWSADYANNLRIDEHVSATWSIPIYPFVFVVALGSAIVCLVLISDLSKIMNQIWKRDHGRAMLLIAALSIVLFAFPVWGRDLLGRLSSFQAGVVGIVVLIIVLFSGIPVGTAMALIGFLGMSYVNSTNAGAAIMGTTPFNVLSSYGNSIIPLFILMGAFCFSSGLSHDLYFSLYKWLGRFPGGLAMATVGACAGFAAVSGSSVATASTMGTVAIPEMKKYKYDDALATGCVAAGGTIGVLIPPSIGLVIYGILTEQSIGKLFFAGFLPGILEAVFYIVTVYILCKRNPTLGPKGPSYTLKEKVFSLKDTWGVFALFILVLGGIYLGVFTPTEAAGIGAFGAFLFAFLKKRMNWKNFKSTLSETAYTTGMALFILLGGKLLGYFLAVTRLPFELANIVTTMDVNRYVILFAIMAVYVFLGAIMSVLAMLILTIPIIFPVVATLGFDPIWFGIIIVRLMEVGQITPPVGVNVFVISGIAKDVPLGVVIRGIVPFIIADVVHIAMLIIFPQVVLFLPNLMS